WCNCAMNGRTDLMPSPRLLRSARNGIPAERIQFRALVAHHHNVQLAVAVDVRGQNVMCARSIRIEDESFELLLARLARVAIPNTAANEINPPITVHVECGQSHIRQIIRPDEMLDPTIGPLKFKPVK